jgi:hypothetical protein
LDGFTQDDRYLYFLLKYATGGDFFTHLRAVGTIDAISARYGLLTFRFYAA